MIDILNVKFSKAVTESKKCLSLSESIALHKIPHEKGMIAYLTRQFKDAVSLEYPETYFTNTNLFNSNYNDIKFHDFEQYFYLSQLSGFGETGKQMLKSLLNDENKTVETPVLLKGRNNIFWQLTGNLQMMAFKVLGILPVVREIAIDADIIP